jgi:hypothetical protein
MKTLTWSDFDQHNPCYSPAEKYGEWSGTILDLLRREDIPAEDRIWAATRNGIVDDKTLRLFACRCAREVWHLLTDERSRNGVQVAERYAVGEATAEELDAAWAAARAAARAAWDATRAARAAACAAWDAARAARAAARAAWDVAKAKQIQIMIELIGGGAL